MNLIAAAKEAIEITREKKYSFSDADMTLPELDYSRVIVISPEEGAKLAQKSFAPAGGKCKVSVTRETSFCAAARFEGTLVMNFANAHVPGGGFLLGAAAQEEALCRCSTLYASITSDAAKEMYRFNNTHLSATESDYMLLSQEVCVFRGDDLELLEKPFLTAVITAPAPNRRGAAAFIGSKGAQEVFRRRIRIILSIAAEYGYKNLVLGAWGCGAFGNSPDMVAEVFREMIVDNGFADYFDNICFAVYGREDSKNYKAFRNMLDNIPGEYK
ncbi:MAG: TIGR02452 family protein [Ruminococcus sp.]|nr:TIGR02452 family protein [Ruminococcus sp.]